MQVLVFPTSLSLSLHTHLHTRARTHKPNIRESNFGKKKSPHPKRFNNNRFHGMWQPVNNTNSSLQGIFNANASVLFIRMCVLHAVTRLREELQGLAKQIKSHVEWTGTTSQTLVWVEENRGGCALLSKSQDVYSHASTPGQGIGV